MNITREIAKKVVETVDKGLVKGMGRAIPGEMCVEAAVCYAQGLPHGDKPTCVSEVLRSFKIALNDSKWSSNAARAKGMRKLAVLQLGTNSGFDEQDFAKRLALFTIKTIVPIALRAAVSLHPNSAHSTAMEASAVACEQAVDFKAASCAANAASAASYAASAASYAASAASYAASAANAANAASYAANAASAANVASYAASAARGAASAARDAVLNRMAEGASQILIDMGVPGVAFLDLLD